MRPLLRVGGRAGGRVEVVLLTGSEVVGELPGSGDSHAAMSPVR